MPEKKEIRLRIPERNWMRAKKSAEEAGVTLSAWLAARLDYILNEEEAVQKLSEGGEIKLAREFPGAHARLAARAKSAGGSGEGKAPLRGFHSEKLDGASGNVLNRLKSLEPAFDKLKKASETSFHGEGWERTSKQFREELKTLKPAIEKLKKASREYLHSEGIESASRHFAEQMKAVEDALRKLTDRKR